MKLHFADDRVLAVVAHPDDAEILCAGTLLRAREDGAAIGICVLCQGNKGQPQQPIQNLTQVRRQEMTEAAKILGAGLLFGGFPDAELSDSPQSRKVLLDYYRQFRPTLVLAHSATDYHADHRAAGSIAETVTWFCASKGHASTAEPLATPPALWWMDTIGMTDFQPEFYIDITAQVDVKHQMLACHRSQIQRGRDGDLSPMQDFVRQQYTTRGAQAGVAAAEGFCAHRAWKRGRAW